MLALEILIPELAAEDGLAAHAVAADDVAALDEEVADDAVEAHAAVVQRGLGELAVAALARAERAEVLARLGRRRRKELDDDAAEHAAVDGKVEPDRRQLAHPRRDAALLLVELGRLTAGAAVGAVALLVEHAAELCGLGAVGEPLGPLDAHERVVHVVVLRVELLAHLQVLERLLVLLLGEARLVAAVVRLDPLVGREERRPLEHLLAERDRLVPVLELQLALRLVELALQQQLLRLLEPSLRQLFLQVELGVVDELPRLVVALARRIELAHLEVLRALGLQMVRLVHHLRVTHLRVVAGEAAPRVELHLPAHRRARRHLVLAAAARVALLPPLRTVSVRGGADKLREFATVHRRHALLQAALLESRAQLEEGVAEAVAR